jgi:hypothetical protein
MHFQLSFSADITHGTMPLLKISVFLGQLGFLTRTTNKLLTSYSAIRFATESAAPDIQGGEFSCYPGA